jgi:hypothetical protein
MNIPKGSIAFFGSIPLGLFATVGTAYAKCYPKGITCDGSHPISKMLGATIVLVPDEDGANNYAGQNEGSNQINPEEEKKNGDSDSENETSCEGKSGE